MVGAWSRTRARAEELTGHLEQSQVQIYDHWEELIEHGELDAVSIATPPAFRREPIVAALEHGLHVLVEKPFTIGLSEARELAGLAEKAKMVTAVSFNWRYSPGSQVTWRAVQEGRIGNILNVSMVWRFRLTVEPEVAFSTGWFGHAELGGGAMREGGSHEFDRARFFTGMEFTSVVGRLPPIPAPGMSADGAYVLIAELSNGGLADFVAQSTPGQAERHFVLFGEDGTLVSTDQTVVCQTRADEEPVSLDIPESDRAPEGMPLIQHTWNRLIADFVTAVRQGDVGRASVPHLPTFADGLRVQELIAAAEQAETERCWVRLEELRE